MVKKKDDISELTFEEALKNLREHSARLESEELNLETALTGYEEAVRLAARCLELLKDAEDRVKIISTSESGKLVLEDFDTDISD